MNDASVHAVNTYWSKMFGCGIAELRPTHGRAFAHAGFAGYEGVYAMMFGDAAPIVSVPAAVLSQAQVSTSNWQPGSIRHTAQAAALLGDQAGRIIGPAALSYADASTFRGAAAAHVVRQLANDSETDHALMRGLRDACTEVEWETGGSDIAHDVLVGAFVDGTLAALAGYEVWGDRIAHLAVITHPAWRGEGLGRNAVVGAAQYALAQGLVLQYRTLESNTSSMRIAHSLGFVPFATSVAVRSCVQP